jgi:hypothetical protein
MTPCRCGVAGRGRDSSSLPQPTDSNTTHQVLLCLQLVRQRGHAADKARLALEVQERRPAQRGVRAAVRCPGLARQHTRAHVYWHARRADRGRCRGCRIWQPRPVLSRCRRHRAGLRLRLLLQDAACCCVNGACQQQQRNACALPQLHRCCRCCQHNALLAGWGSKLSVGARSRWRVFRRVNCYQVGCECDWGVIWPGNGALGLYERGHLGVTC